MSFERPEQAEKGMAPAVASENSFGNASRADIQATFHGASNGSAEAHLPSVHLAMNDSFDAKNPSGGGGAPKDRPPIIRPNPMPQPRPVPHPRI